MRTEFKYFQKLIQDTQGCKNLKRLNWRLLNLYNNGVFTPSQFSKLDMLLLDKRVEAEQ